DGRLAPSHVGDDESTLFDARVRRLSNPLVEGTAGGLSRLLDASAVAIVEPAVINAAQPAVFDAGIAQIRAAVGAMNSEQARPTVVVTEEHEILAEHAH